MILYDDGKVGKALEPHFVETHIGSGLHVYEDRTQAGDIVFITTDKFKKYIPIKYIEAFKKEVKDVTNGKAVIDWLLEEWGKENADTN